VFFCKFSEVEISTSLEPLISVMGRNWQFLSVAVEVFPDQIEIFSLQVTLNFWKISITYEDD